MILSRQTIMKVTLIKENHKPEKIKRKVTKGMSMHSNKIILLIWLTTDLIKKKMIKMVPEH